MYERNYHQIPTEHTFYEQCCNHCNVVMGFISYFDCLIISADLQFPFLTLLLLLLSFFTLFLRNLPRLYHSICS